MFRFFGPPEGQRIEASTSDGGRHGRIRPTSLRVFRRMPIKCHPAPEPNCCQPLAILGGAGAALPLRRTCPTESGTCVITRWSRVTILRPGSRRSSIVCRDGGIHCGGDGGAEGTGGTRGRERRSGAVAAHRLPATGGEESSPPGFDHPRGLERRRAWRRRSQGAAAQRCSLR